MKKVDFKEELKHLYQPLEDELAIVNVPPMNFLMIDGLGDPNRSVEFKQSIEALYTVSYVIKYAVEKSKLEIDYGVMPLEGIWWCESDKHYRLEDAEKWLWTLMIMQPDYVHRDLVEAAIKEAEKQRNLPALPDMRFDSFFEGPAVQLLHRGLFYEEAATLEKVHTYIRENDLIFGGRHHEIYLSDIRRQEQDRWRTIIRQPVKKREHDEI